MAIDSSQLEVKNERAKKRKFYFLVLTLVVIAAIAMTLLWYLFIGQWYQSTEDAYVDGNILQVSSEIAGTVVSINADEGNLVKQGQVLIQLDKADPLVLLHQAAANLAKTVRKVQGLYSSVKSYKSDVAARKVQYKKAYQDYQRRKNLAESGAISQEELAHAQNTLALAESDLAAAEHTLSSNAAMTQNTVITTQPEVKLAAAKLRQAYLDYSRTTIYAPATGYVTKRTVQVGQHIAVGSALLALVPLNEVWVDANFKETELRHMRIGQPVTLVSDLYGNDVVYNGQIQSLGIGTGSAFSILPAQNATGNWIKIVQRLPVRITLEPTELAQHPLRIGLSMQVKVNLHESGPLLANTTSDKPRYTTDIYQHQLQKADALVAKIIQQNTVTDVPT